MDRPSFPRILTPDQSELLAEERRLLGDLQATLARFEGKPDDQATLRSSLHQLDELFLLVVAGEFNSGKSAVINALLGERVAEEGVTPTTARIHLIKHADNAGDARESAVEVVTARAELLRNLNIVDTPGTNAIFREHETLTREFIPRSDLVLFVTSADRPFTESERSFLEAIRDWGKKIVVVINKVDIILRSEDVQRIEAFVAERATELLGRAPAVFPVSAREALAARLGEADNEAFERSRFAALEGYLVDTLDEAERVRLKLLSPLGVGTRLVATYLGVAGERAALLADDFTSLEDIERQLEVYREDMRREFRFRLADVENVLHEFESRGMEFFDDTLRLGRVFDLINRSKLKGEFERKVVADMPQVVERRVSQVIDWMVERELRQWRAVTDLVARRRTRHADRILGPEGQGFDYDRARLLETVGRTANRTVEAYDKEREADRLAESVQMSLAGLAVIEVSAIGLGAVVTALASTTLVDVTGIVAAGALAAVGLFVIPARRRAAKEELRSRIEALRSKLMESLTGQFEQEVSGGVERIREAIAPYTRFVRAERGRLDEMRQELEGIRDGCDRLRSRLEALAASS